MKKPSESSVIFIHPIVSDTPRVWQLHITDIKEKLDYVRWRNSSQRNLQSSTTVLCSPSNSKKFDEIGGKTLTDLTTMSDRHPNQHYVTESFVKKQFGTGIGGHVRRYDLQSDTWKLEASPQFVFSSRGYTQLLIDGEPIDNSLEDSFSKLESGLGKLLSELMIAAQIGEKRLSEEDYNNLCFYCSYLWYLSLFGKAKAPVDYVAQLDFDLNQGNPQLLLEMGMNAVDIYHVLALHFKGFKFILRDGNFLQWVFRAQFVRSAGLTAGQFRHNVKWTVYNSPIELPISDIPFIMWPEGKEAMLYIWPISPSHVLIGRLPFGSPPIYQDTLIYGKTLPLDAAEDVLDIICLSAVKAIACQNKMDIPVYRKRGAEKQFVFTKINDINAVLSAGQKPFDPSKDVCLIPVTEDKFHNFMLSFITPPRPKELRLS